MSTYFHVSGIRDVPVRETLLYCVLVSVYKSTPTASLYQPQPRQGAEELEQQHPRPAEPEGDCSERGRRAESSAQDGGGDEGHDPTGPHRG